MFAILLVAVLLRAWALDFGLPNLTRPDEQNIANAALIHILQTFFAGTPDLNPQFFNYPSLFIYLVGFCYAIYYLLGHLLGYFADGMRFFDLYFNDWSSFFYISRWLSVIFGTLTVWAAYRLGKVFFQSRPLGIITAFLLAVTYPHVRDSHFGVTDITATFWTTLCLWQAVEAFQRKHWRSLRLAAIFAGLAASTKYPNGLVAIAPLIALYFMRADEGYKLGDFLNRTPLLKQGLALIGWVAAAFLLTSPFVLLDFQTFQKHFEWQQQSFRQLSTVGVQVSGWIYYLTFSLWQGLGPVYLGFSLLGIALGAIQAIKHQQKTAWILLSFVAIYYLAIGSGKTVFVRYIIPLLPVLAVYAVCAMQWLIRQMQTRLPLTIPAPVAYGILIIAIAGTTLMKSVAFDCTLAKPDTRTLARNWLIANLKPGDGVGIGKLLSHIDMPNHYKKYILAPQERLEMPNGSPLRFIEPKEIEAQDQPINARQERNINTYTNAAALRARNIRYVVLGKTVLKAFEAPAFELEKAARNPELKLVQRFSPTASNNEPPENAYDPYDAFYIPYSQPNAIQRPGPDILIYEVLPSSQPVAPPAAAGPNRKS